MPPRIHIVSDDPSFDPDLLSHLTAEGFTTTYIPLLPPEKPDLTPLRHIADDLEFGESYAILAFGSAASACLDFYATPQPHICALVAYYPTHISSPLMKFPPSLHVLTHLAASQHFAPAFPSYTYSAVQPGFAERDLEEFDDVAASLAWTRSLGLLRRAFKLEGDHAADLERVWEEHVALAFSPSGGKGKEDAAAARTEDAMRNFVPDEPSLAHIPTLTGGIGTEALSSFYHASFLTGTPPSTRMRLISRTIGVDRLVDEFILSFEHTSPITWLLPNVQPTGKKVSIPIVAVVGFKGGKVWKERVYWDQASVLVQVGLLDGKLLPVVGREEAGVVLGERGVGLNGLLEGEGRGKGMKGEGMKLPERPNKVAGAGGG